MIKKLKRRGYRTLLVDYLDNPPAASAADLHIRASTLDQEAVLKIGEEHNADLVISGCVDQANVTACYVAERLHLPAPYSHETALRVTDKALMKEGMVNAGVPTASHAVVPESEIDTWKSDVFPVVVKPCDCNGSKGVRKANDQDELHQNLVEAIEYSRTKKAIVERLNTGIEVNGYFYIENNVAHDLYLKGKQHSQIEGRSALQSFVSIGPAVISEEARSKLRSAATRIAAEFELLNTPLLVQAHVDGDNVKVIEFAPRVGGGLAFREIQILTGFDIVESVIQSYLHEPVDTASIRVPTEMVSIVHLYGTQGVFERVEGMENLLSARIVEEYHLHKSPGMSMTSDDLASRNRVLGAIIRGSTAMDLREKTERMINDLRIISSDNRDVLNRRVFGSKA